MIIIIIIKLAYNTCELTWYKWYKNNNQHTQSIALQRPIIGLAFNIDIFKYCQKFVDVPYGIGAKKIYNKKVKK